MKVDPSKVVHSLETEVKHGLNMWKEFKAFAIKGNVIDLAVAVVVGAAFTGIVNSLVKDIITPPLSLVTGGLNFSNKFILLKSGTDGRTDYATPDLAVAAKAIPWTWGAFVTALISFFLVSFSVFLVIRLLSKLKKPDPAAPPSTKDCPECTMTIPIAAKRCPHCTSVLPAGAAGGG